MNRTKLISIIASGLLLAGCAGQQPYQITDRICPAGTDTAAAIEASEAVLEEMLFSIDKLDTDQGLITTRPLEAPQLFEFWRKDNAGAFNSAEANLHTLRRTAQINIDSIDGKTCIDCTVKTERLSLPERQIAGSAHAYSLYTKSRSSRQRLKLDRSQQAQMQWIDLGEDPYLQSRILELIKDKLKETQL